MISSSLIRRSARPDGTVPSIVFAARSFNAAVLARERPAARSRSSGVARTCFGSSRSEEHTSELQSHHDLVCRLLLEKKKKKTKKKKVKKNKRAEHNQRKN